MAGRKGPVVLNIPRDHFAAQIDVAIQKPDDYPVFAAGTINVEQLRAIQDLLTAAKAPVIIAGAGVKWGRGTEKVIRLAEMLQIPITASAGHGDVIPTDHPLFAGQVGPRGNPVASRLAREADVILALGTRLGFNTTFYAYNDRSEEHTSELQSLMRIS